jgi:hypothetical protein
MSYHQNNKLLMIGVFLLVLMSTVVRFQELNRLIEYHESVTSIIISESSTLDTIVCAGNDNSPPLYQILLLKFKEYFSGTWEDKITMRIPNFILGILFIFLMTFYVYKKKWDTFICLIVCALSGLLFQIHSIAAWSRSSMLHLFFSGILGLIFLEVINDGWNKKKGLLFIVFTALNFYTHYFSCFMFLSQFIILEIYSFKKGNRIVRFSLLYYIIPIILYFPWFNNFVSKRLFNVEGDFWIQVNWLNDLMGIFGAFFSSNILFVGTIFLFITLVIRKKKGVLDEVFTSLLSFVFIFIFLVIVKSLTGTYVVRPRYFVSIYPILILLVGYMISKSDYKKIFCSFYLIVIVLNNSLFLDSFYLEKSMWIHKYKGYKVNFKCKTT